MLPITGPTSEVIDQLGFYQDRFIYRQKKPYNIRLPYYARVTTVSPNKYSGAAYTAEPSRTDTILVRNKCYSRFLDKVRGESAGWGINLAQHQQARAMFNQRALNLLEYITKLERNFRRRRWKKTSREWSSFFLEMRFGWIPIISDIYQTMEILSSDVPSSTVRASARSPYKIVAGSASDWSFNIRVNGVLRYSMIADVSVSNPNLLLLNQLGLINPAAILWDAVPWSFVIDWWANFGQVAQSFTDFYGLSIGNAVTTKKVENSGLWYYHMTSGQPVDLRQTTTEMIDRVQGIEGPALVIKPFQGLSMVRGATAIALVVQKLNY